MALPIDIALPVGPNPAYREYLTECIESIAAQTLKPRGIIIIDDMAHINFPRERKLSNALFRMIEEYNMDFKIIRNKTLLGCGLSWNIGVREAFHEHVFMLGSDDKLLPNCLEECSKYAEEVKDKLGYYAVTCELSEGGQQNLPINAALVTKALWEWTGGFPISSTIGAPDALLLSILSIYGNEHIHRVKEFTSLYWIRQHAEQDSKIASGVFPGETVSIRNIETNRWIPPTWSRYDR